MLHCVAAYKYRIALRGMPRLRRALRAFGGQRLSPPLAAAGDAQLSCVCSSALFCALCVLWSTARSADSGGIIYCIIILYNIMSYYINIRGAQSAPRTREAAPARRSPPLAMRSGLLLVCCTEEHRVHKFCVLSSLYSALRGLGRRRLACSPLPKMVRFSPRSIWFMKMPTAFLI